MIVFFNLINISGINAYVLYKNDKKDEKSFSRYNFLQKLAFQLIEPLLAKRMQFKQISTEVRSKCAKLLGLHPPTEESRISFGPLDRSGPPSNKPQGSCGLCQKSQTAKKFKNSRNTCSKCDIFVCPDHFYKICDECISK